MPPPAQPTELWLMGGEEMREPSSSIGPVAPLQAQPQLQHPRQHLLRRQPQLQHLRQYLRLRLVRIRSLSVRSMVVVVRRARLTEIVSSRYSIAETMWLT